MGALRATLGLFYPGAFWVLAACGAALLLTYLVRQRPRRMVVSSVLAFRALRQLERQRFGLAFRVNWMFFAELAVLALAALAMAEPYLVRPNNPVAVVLDNSAAMQAVASDGKSRFAAAVAGTVAALRKAANPRVTIYLTAPQPHPLEPAEIGAQAVEQTLATLRPLDAPDDALAVSRLVADLVAGGRFGRIIFASYRRLAASAPASVEQITVGAPLANYALGPFVLRRAILGSQMLSARLAVANFSPAAQTLKVTVTGDGRALAQNQQELKPGEIGALEIPSLPPAHVYEARLEPADGFALDNVAYATAASARATRVLFISPVAAHARGLDRLPGISVRTVAPDHFSPADLASADLAIFEYAAPKATPPVNSLLVMPPPSDPVFNFAVRPQNQVQVTAWPTTDKLTDSVNFRLLNVRSGEYFATHPWMSAVVSGSDGALLLAGERDGRRFVALGFDPFPYLGKANLPMSVLTLNVLSYLAGLGANITGFRTGQPWIVPAGIETIVTPAGEKIAVRPGALFTATSGQGVYELLGPGGVGSARAVNLADLTVSDLENVPPLRVEVQAAPAAHAAATLRLTLGWYLLAAALALAALEAVLVYRRRLAVGA